MEWVDAVVDFPKPAMTWGLLSSIDDMAWHADAMADRLDEVTTVYRLSYESVRHLRPEVLLKAVRRQTFGRWSAEFLRDLRAAAAER